MCNSIHSQLPVYSPDYSQQAAPLAPDSNPQSTPQTMPSYQVDPYYNAPVGQPAGNPRLTEYLAQPAANENEKIVGLEAQQYGSIPVNQAQLILGAGNKEYIVGAVVIPLEANKLAGKLYESKIANVFNPLWKSSINEAAKANGGLGNSEDGFLAWSKDGHFVRLRNPGFTPEQNRKLAMISLTGGWAVEDLISRSSDTTFKDLKANKAVQDVISRFENSFAAFLQDPQKGMSVKDGKRRFEMKYIEEAGMVASYNYKKKGGLGGFIQKNFKGISKVLDGISLVSRFIPGWGTIVSFGAQALKQAGAAIATGKVKIQNALSLVGSTVGGWVSPLMK